MSPIYWDDRPPSDAPRRLPIPIWIIRPGGKAFVRFLGPWRGVRLHWHQGRSRPCEGRGCPLCAAGEAARWQGYAPALLWDRDPEQPEKPIWRPIVCPITEAMAELLVDQVVTGLVIEVERVRRRNGEITCTIQERPVKDPLPPAFDVVPILLRAWGIRTKPQLEREQAGDGDQQPSILPFVRPPEEDAGPLAQEGGTS